MVFASLLKMGIDHATREDICQMTWMKVWSTRLAGFNPENKLGPYLYTIARNKAFDQFRKKQSRPTQPLPANLPQPATPDSDSLSFAEITQHLSPDKRNLLKLQYIDGLPPREIAKIVGMPAMTVAQQIFRIRRQLYSSVLQLSQPDQPTAPQKPQITASGNCCANSVKSTMRLAPAWATDSSSSSSAMASIRPRMSSTLRR